VSAPVVYESKANLSPMPIRRRVPLIRTLNDHVVTPFGVSRTRNPGAAPSTSSSVECGSGLHRAIRLALNAATRLGISDLSDDVWTA